MDNQYNNGFGFNTQNGYDQNNQYNQYNQYNQPMNYNQMPQQQMYNQYPNQYDPNGGMYVQPTVHKNNRGGGVFSFIIALLLVAGLVVFLLDYTGKVDVKALYNKVTNKESKKEEKKEEPEEEKAATEEETKKETSSEEEELDKMCRELDEEGFYNKEFVDQLGQKISELPDTTGVAELWALVEGSKYCSQQECHIYETGSEHVVHDYVCITKKYTKTTLDDKMNQATAETYLGAACRSLDESGNPIESPSSPIGQIEGLTCSDFVCKITYKEKEYSLNCKEE